MLPSRNGHDFVRFCGEWPTGGYVVFPAGCARLARCVSGVSLGGGGHVIHIVGTGLRTR